MSEPFPPIPAGLPTGIAKPHLFTPGPTISLPAGRLAALAAEWHHRTPSFEAAFAESRERLAALMGLEGPVALIAASGTGGMEAALVNTVGPGQEAIVVNAGKFGERWGEILEAYGAVPRVLEVEWGASAQPDQVREILARFPAARALCVQASETSTGAAHDLPAMAAVAREAADCLLIADAVSWMGAAPLTADEWGVDVVVGGSQKAFMMGPGLTWVGLGERAVRRQQQDAGAARFYFDLARQGKPGGRSAFTPAIDLVMALVTALRFIQDEVGAERFILNALRQATAFRAALPELGLAPFAAHPTPSLTAIKVPEELDGAALLKRLEHAYGVKAAGGQAHMKGKLLRFAHMGYYDLYDTIGCVSALELALADLDHPVEPGRGPAAAQRAAHAFDRDHAPAAGGRPPDPD